VSQPAQSADSVRVGVSGLGRYANSVKVGEEAFVSSFTEHIVEHLVPRVAAIG
jgi:hypothetical protein